MLERGLSECKILTANNPLIAINILLRREINLVILDADYNGLEMLGRIRDDERFKGMAVMMMSSSTQREIVASVFALGVQDYVTKPCAPTDLIGRVQKLLNLTEKEDGTEPRPQKTSFNIVLIDDDIFDLRQERETLKNRIPCQITTAQSAAEGMKILEQSGADLVLISLDMPFVNGLKFLDSLGSTGSLISRSTSNSMATPT